MTEQDAEGWFDNESATLGDRITGAREAAAMTQKDLAKRLGVKLATIRSWENDMSEPRANKLSMLAGLLNVSMRWLLEGEGEGISAPEETVPLSEDAQALLREIRAMKVAANKTANRLGGLEKRLASVLREQGLA